MHEILTPRRMMLVVFLLGFTGPGHAATSSQVVRVGIIINPYAGARIEDIQTVKLLAEDEKAYGLWNRFGLASGRLADMASANAAGDGLIRMREQMRVLSERSDIV